MDYSKLPALLQLHYLRYFYHRQQGRQAFACSPSLGLSVISYQFVTPDYDLVSATDYSTVRWLLTISSCIIRYTGT